MQSKQVYFKCVLCDKEAEYIIRGDSMCKEHKDREEIALRMMGGINEEEN